MPKIKEGASLNAAVDSAAAAQVLSTEPPRPRLPCSLNTFFPFCRLAWSYCQQNLSQFTSDSPRFTTAFIDQQLLLVNDTAALPNAETRRAAATIALLQLKSDAQAVKMLCQKLKTYIEYAYEPNAALTEAALKESGIWYYDQLGTKWREIDSKIESASIYMGANLNKLTERDNMPAGFPLEFKAAADAFKLSWANFISKEAAIQDGTGTQEAGIRQILAELNPMLKTGKRIFIFDPVMRRKFTASSLKYEVQGHMPGGVGSTIRDAVTTRRLAGVTVSAMVEGVLRSVVSNERGLYKLQLPAGTYDIRYEAPGYEPFILAGRKVQPGVTGRPEVNLQPLPVLAAVDRMPSPDPSALEKAVIMMHEQAKELPAAVAADENGLQLAEVKRPS